MNSPAELVKFQYNDEIPQSARTRSGVNFDPTAQLWRFRDGNNSISINFRNIPDLAKTLIPGLKLTLIWYLENRSPLTAENAFNKFLYLIKHLTNDRDIPILQITQEDILIFKISSDRAIYNMAYLRPFFRRWTTLDAPGVGKDVPILLDQLRLKQNPTGVAVATLDPKEGPLTDLEFESIQCALTDSYASGQIQEDTFLLAFLFMAIGGRPVQFSALKICDLIAPKNPNESGDYVLMVPRAKQKNHLPRDEFKARVLARHIGEPLQRHVEKIYAQFKNKLPDPWQAPMFQQKYIIESANAIGYNYHQTTRALSNRVIEAFKKLQVPSERLSEPMPITPIRLRRTFATRAAEEGLPLIVIAEMMDHANTRNVEIYAGLTSRIKARLSRAVALNMAPLAQAFGGRIIRSEANATHPELSSRIIDLRVDQTGSGIGSCGSHAYCGFAKPIACYACNNYEPWLDGPHEAMLEYLLERRDYLMKTADPRIASINDRSILGCAQVVLRCKELKGTTGS